MADLQSDDWRECTLALRDLVRVGRQTVSPVLELLDRDDEHVRQVAAMVLEILRAETAVDSLSRLLRNDPDPVVRSLLDAGVTSGYVGP